MRRKTTERKNHLKKEKSASKQSLAIVLIASAALVLLFFYRGRNLPLLTAYGLKEWATVCEGEGRLYRLYSKNLSNTVTNQRTSLTLPSITNRDLQFLDEEGKILYFTNYFYKNSLDKDFVWRFKNTGANLAVRLFDKAKPSPSLYKILSVLFPADYKKYKDRKANKALKGDEVIFEISADFDQLSLILKGGERIQIPCQPLSQ